MLRVAHGMIEISMLLRTFLRSGLTVLWKESPCFSKGRKSNFALMALANDIAKLGTGTTFKEVSGATVSNILIPLPPLAEQERIVAKLDALLPKVQALNDL